MTDIGFMQGQGEFWTVKRNGKVFAKLPGNLSSKNAIEICKQIAGEESGVWLASSFPSHGDLEIELIRAAQAVLAADEYQLDDAMADLDSAQAAFWYVKPPEKQKESEHEH